MRENVALEDAEILRRLGRLIQQQRGRKSPLVPIVASVLQSAIESGDLKPGGKLANEIVLAEKLDVSRPTLRQAIGILVHDGALELRRGVGTFVAPKRSLMRSDVEKMRSATQLIRASGHVPGTRDCQVDEEVASPEVASILRLSDTAKVLVITRTRTADEQPLIVCREYLPSAIFGPASVFDSFDGTSLYHFIAEKFDVLIDHCETSIAAVSATREIARRLEITKGTPLLELTQLHLRGGAPVFFSHNFHNSALVRFETLRTVLSDSAGE